jgi:hypothetical protein
MRKPIHNEAAELILASMSQCDSEGLKASFMFGKLGAPLWDRHMGTDLYFRPNKLTRAVLYVRQKGPAYDSRKYGRYYDDYEADTIHDLELVVTSCLRQQIFGGAEGTPDPNAALIAKAQATGRLPKSLKRNTILEDDPTA